MATFEQKQREIADRYAAAARTQNHRLFREALIDHWELLREHDGPADDLITALTANGRRILGRPIDSVTVDELVDLVSSVREDMTESQRLSVFMQELLASNGGAPTTRQATQRAVGVAPRFSRPLRSTRANYDDDFDYPDVDFTPNRSIGAAAQGIIAVVVVLLLLAGLLYVLSQL